MYICKSRCLALYCLKTKYMKEGRTKIIRVLSLHYVQQVYAMSAPVNPTLNGVKLIHRDVQF